MLDELMLSTVGFGRSCYAHASAALQGKGSMSLQSHNMDTGSHTIQANFVFHVPWFAHLNL